MPYMYPEKPDDGTTKKTKARRNRMLLTFSAKVVPVFPRPFRILHSVPDRYKKGHTRDKARIWPAATDLLKRSLPSRLAKTEKNRRQNTPSAKQNPIVSQMILRMRFSSPRDCASDTEGSRREDTEWSFDWRDELSAEYCV